MALGICRYQGISYHRDLDLDKSIYKFMPLNRFLEAVSNNKMYLRNILFWDDKWELPTQLFDTDGLDEYSAWFIKKNDRVSTFATCFTEQYDTDAMWRLYSPKQDSVCIETTPRLLLREMQQNLSKESVYLGPVIYCDIKQNDASAIFNNAGRAEYPHMFYASFIKRNAFLHEKEIRLAVQFVDHSYSREFALDSVFVPLDFRKIIKSIILDPRLTKVEAKYHTDALKGLERPVNQSTLYGGTHFNGKDYASMLRQMLGDGIAGAKTLFFKE